MEPVFIGIAGGSGAGKSTVCYALVDKYPEEISVLHFDDYHRNPENVPIHFGMKNWDHPDSMDFDKAVAGIRTLKSGKPIEMETKDRHINPGYLEKGRIRITVHPKPVVLIEGFLVLWDKKIRDLLDCRIYLDASQGIRMARRAKFINEEYTRKILANMHKRYVENTKKYAEHIISVDRISKEGLIQKVEQIVKQFMRAHK